jgi:hypothetical protein
MSSPLVVWSVVYNLYAGMPQVHEEMVFPFDVGCGEFCSIYTEHAHAWAVKQRLSTARGKTCTCLCVFERQCARPDCNGEKLFSNVMPR